MAYWAYFRSDSPSPRREGTRSGDRRRGKGLASLRPGTDHSRPAVFVRTFALLAASWLLGCSEATVGDDGVGGAPPTPGAESVAFLPGATLLLEPGFVGELVVQVQPPGFHSVSFSLMANPSDTAFDGFLEAANVVTDETGQARNQLQAPTSSAVFVVRASVSDTVFTTRTVSVSTEGFATLVAIPAYTGARSIGSWSAVASLGVTCSDLESMWEEGALEAEGDEDMVTLPGVPVGSPVALVLRAGHYIGGCVSVSDLSAGEVRELEVAVTDRPLQLTGTSLELSLDVEERTESFVALLGEAAVRGATDYAMGHGEDADVLFADCAEAIEDEADREAFNGLAETYGYADIVRAHLSAQTALRDVVQAELVEAATHVDGPSVWMVTAELDGTSSTLVLSSAAGVPAAVSGFLGSAVLSVGREPNDLLVLGADLEFQPTRWLAAIAKRSNDQDPLDLLLEAADCTALAEAWIQAAGGELYPGCDEECAVELCEDGLQLGWDRARETAKDLTTLRIGISGEARIDDEATPIGLTGDWVGSIDAGELSVAGPTSSPIDEVP